MPVNDPPMMVNAESPPPAPAVPGSSNGGLDLPAPELANVFSITLRLPQSVSAVTSFGPITLDPTSTDSSAASTNPVPTTVTSSLTSDSIRQTQPATSQQSVTSQSSISLPLSQTTTFMTSASSGSSDMAQQTAAMSGGDTETTTPSASNKAGVVAGGILGSIACIAAFFAIGYLLYQYRKGGGMTARSRRESYREMAEEPEPAPPAPPQNRNSMVSGVTLQNGMMTSDEITYAGALPPPRFPQINQEASRGSWHPGASPAPTLRPPMRESMSSLPPTPTLPLPTTAEMSRSREDPHGLSRSGSGFSKLNTWLEENRRRSKQG